MVYQPMNLRKIDKRLFTILLIVFVQMLGAAMALPILLLYAQRQFQLQPEVNALLLSSFFAAQFLAGSTIGRLSDKYGRIPVLIVSQIGTVISFIMIGAAPNVTVLFVARILDGITGGNIIVAQAYITDITPPEKRTESLGYIFAAFGLGFVFGPALGGVLSAAFGPRIPFFMAAVAATVTVVLTWLTLTESLTPEQRIKNRSKRSTSLNPVEIFRNAPLLAILLIAFIGQFALGLLQATFALYGDAVLFAEYSDRIVDIGIGILLATVGLSQFLTQTVLIRQVLPRFGEANLVIIGGVLRAIGMFFFAIASAPWLGLPGSLFFAMGMGLMMPPLQSLSTRTVPDEVRGGVLGLYQSTISLATIFSTAIGGVIFALNPRYPYWLGMGLSLFALIPAYFFLRRPLTKPKPETAVHE
ncbi:MAG: tetracycline resistance MFS efflux pump [Ardenticatenaceae bacterium]|nr:MAG: tetracycline resistance MFS efflux pump [Ardenticatenaceae bacterium]